MIRKDPTKTSIPIAFWDSEEPREIPILHQTPLQAALARWLKPLGRPALRKSPIALNRPEPL